jgi:hypothetical protein
MNFPEMTEAVADAERTLRIADSHVTALAKLLVGRLRKVSTGDWSHTLRYLKRELRDFDSRTEKWT